MKGTEGTLALEPPETMKPSDGVVGETSQIQEVRRVIQRVSQVRWPVLLLGETGTGKEFVARAIHAKTFPKGAPFVSVDCGSAPNLIEDELFGPEGRQVAHAATSGQISDLAQGGTLFLDEVSELPASGQARIIRLLEGKTPVTIHGGEKAVRFRGRIIAASTRSAPELLHGKKFRSDLFFRLNVVSLTIPPLRERKSDIPLLVQDIFRRISASLGVSPGAPPQWALSAQALDSLLLYDWPGNVRELEDCVKRAVLLSSGRILEPSDLFPPLHVRSVGEGDETKRTPVPLRQTERRAIMESLQAAGWKKPLAAEMLGIGKSTLYRKLHDYQATDKGGPRTPRKRN